jgi:hypothetical protein
MIGGCVGAEEIININTQQLIDILILACYAEFRHWACNWQECARRVHLCEGLSISVYIIRQTWQGQTNLKAQKLINAILIKIEIRHIKQWWPLQMSQFVHANLTKMCFLYLNPSNGSPGGSELVIAPKVRALEYLMGYGISLIIQHYVYFYQRFSSGNTLEDYNP